MSESQYILNEAPITSEEEDIFNFNHYASKVNQIIQRNSFNSAPLTIGIYGKWGEGKTSFLNILQRRLSEHEGYDNSKRILKYNFNPWRYSTEDEMLFAFFEGLSKILLNEQKDTNLQTAGKYILKFSRYLKAIKLSSSIGIPKYGAEVTFEPHEIFKALGEDLIGKEISLESIKEKIDIELEASEYKIIVLIDDIDRLDKNEIFMLLKIIKLNANFKNLIYVIALDPKQVAKAIHHRYGKNQKDGKVFLEKIINIPIVLPRIEIEDLTIFFRNNLMSISKALDLKDKNDEFNDIIHSFKNFNFNSLREIIRTLNSFSISAFAIGEEVNLNDLFWIEYLKISNPECYNEIKQFDEETMFFSSPGIIDFNNELGTADTTNGFRKKLFKKYPQSKNIIDHLFPNTKLRIPSEPIDSKELDKKLKINSVEHFEKYFSYNTNGKVSYVEIKKLKQLINNQNSTDLQNLLKELLSGDQSYKIVLKLEDLIDEFEEVIIRDFFYRFLFENIQLIPNSGRDLFGIDERTRIVETIARNLNKETIDNREIVIELAKKLNLTHLCYFTRKFDETKQYKKDLYPIIIEKAKELENPFFTEPKNHENKMIMAIWKELNGEEFSTYLSENMNSETLKLLIRNFPVIWNDEYFGHITQENYNYIKQLLNIDFIVDRIKEFYPELVLEDYDTTNWTDFEESSIEENIQQILFWHKKD